MRTDMTTRTVKKFRLRINGDLCKGCGLCADFCAKDVLAMTKDRLNCSGVPFAEVVAADQCTGCQACTVICPDAAIELFQVEQ